jgi:flavorubredoxin
MEHSFKPLRISEHVYWVGAIDWGIRDFHGYSTSRGTTYNAYLMVDDTVTLIDTVKAPFRDEMLSRISCITDPGNIRTILSNHSEMDHSGCLPDLLGMGIMRPEKMYASIMGEQALRNHFHLENDIVAVKDGERISLGNLNITCYETRMLHWPDSMITYLAEDRLLFSQDGFGMHLASSERFADEIAGDVLEYEGAKYFANILLPYSMRIVRLLDRLKSLSLDIAVLAPDHGPVWRRDLSTMLGWYAKWAAQTPEKKAAIAYATMWHSTELMARAIGEGLFAEGIHAALLPLGSTHRSDVVTELLDAAALLVGSPTINNNMFPSVSDLLTYLKGLKPQNLIGGAFGSYGWSGESVKHINEILRQMGVDLVTEGLSVKYVPDESSLLDCFRLGRAVGKAVIERCAATER